MTEPELEQKCKTLEPKKSQWGGRGSDSGLGYPRLQMRLLCLFLLLVHPTRPVTHALLLDLGFWLFSFSQCARNSTGMLSVH